MSKTPRTDALHEELTHLHLGERAYDRLLNHARALEEESERLKAEWDRLNNQRLDEKGLRMKAEVDAERWQAVRDRAYVHLDGKGHMWVIEAFGPHPHEAAKVKFTNDIDTAIAIRRKEMKP